MFSGLTFVCSSFDVNRSLHAKPSLIVHALSLVPFRSGQHKISKQLLNWSGWINEGEPFDVVNVKCHKRIDWSDAWRQSEEHRDLHPFDRSGIFNSDIFLGAILNEFLCFHYGYKPSVFSPVIFINVISPINMAQSISWINAAFYCGWICGICIQKQKRVFNVIAFLGEPLLVGLSEAAGNPQCFVLRFFPCTCKLTFHQLMEKYIYMYIY